MIVVIPVVSRINDMSANQVLGFWVYLMSDLLLFSAIFATFAVLSRSYGG